LVKGSKATYIPRRGHVVWLDFDPQTGHEQAGRRPALVLSPVAYNRPSALAVMCPVTRRKKGYSFEVDLPKGLPIAGVVLADQVKNLDWKQRRATYICDLPPEVLEDVIQKLYTLLEPDDSSNGSPFSKM
jgi:mRNA interferase MazF